MSNLAAWFAKTESKSSLARYAIIPYLQPSSEYRKHGAVACHAHLSSKQQRAYLPTGVTIVLADAARPPDNLLQPPSLSVCANHPPTDDIDDTKIVVTYINVNRECATCTMYLFSTFESKKVLSSTGMTPASTKTVILSRDCHKGSSSDPITKVGVDAENGC
jgi:hypothetical protein